MNTQVLFVSVVLLSVSVAILFYQNVKLSRKLDQQYNSVNKNMTDLSRMIALNNNINLEGGAGMPPDIMNAPPMGDVVKGNDEIRDVNLEPQVTEEFKQEINQLKNEYQDYELSSELKNEIDNLERMENLPESMELSRENLEELQNAQMDNRVEVADGVEGAEDAEEEFVEEQDQEKEDVEELTGDMDLQELETGESLSGNSPNLDNQIVDWNNEVETEEISEVDLNPPESISLESSDIKAEVEQGVNELVGNIIASASDVEIVNDENVIKLSNDEQNNIMVNINNEERTLEDLNGTELKDVCKYFNLKAKGKKIELVERIKDYQINLKNSKNFFVLGN